MPPIVGINTNAITNDDDKTAKKRVITGRKNINSPATPGQKIKGKMLLVLLM